MNTAVSCELQLRLVVSRESSLPVPASLRYEAADPYIVHAAFHTDADKAVEWVFARDLLAGVSTGPPASATSACGRPGATARASCVSPSTPARGSPA